MAPQIRQVSEVLKPCQTYFSIVDAGRAKLYMNPIRLFFAAILGGLLIAAYGHCATLGSSRFVEYLQQNELMPVTQTMGLANLTYAIIFCGAFAGIVSTGADLFTSNCLYLTSFMLTHQEEALHKETWLRTFGVLIVSYLGNAFGASVMGAGIFTLYGDYFNPHLVDNGGVNHPYSLICNMARGKISTHHPISAAFCNGIGCNFFVAMATWKTKYAQDAVGQYVGAMFPVLAFCVGGFQHIIANMYTLVAAMYLDCSDVTLEQVFYRNILPVTAGNIVGGMLVAILGYAIHGNGDRNFGIEHEVLAVRNCEDCQTTRNCDKCETGCDGDVYVKDIDSSLSSAETSPTSAAHNLSHAHTEPRGDRSVRLGANPTARFFDET